jgi:hypothetical protein
VDSRGDDADRNGLRRKRAIASRGDDADRKGLRRGRAIHYRDGGFIRPTTGRNSRW